MGVTGLNSVEMVYNENNQLVKYNDETVKYDADGNMIYGPLNGKMADFKYDCRNRLVSAGGTTYAYDAENNRISKTVDKIKTEYVIDSTGSLTRILTASTDSKTTYFVYGIGLISQEYDNEVLFYHFNNIGSTEAVTSLDGKIQEKFEYGPYGELLSENKCGTIFLYNGEYGVSTDENGLYYMRARYYNPEIKRFINQDVVIGSIVDSPSLNRYAYVEGNPISLADPFGLSPGIDWRGAAHFLLGGLSLLTLIPTPVTYIIGAAASIANAALYAEEGNYFAAICNAIPVFGGGFSLLGKAGNASCWLMKTLQYSTAGLSIGVGTYDIYQIGKGNYQKYVVRGEDFSLGDMFSDLFRGAMDVVSIAGGAKLASEKISYCFVAGTLVTTEQGQKPIEEIKVGDKVLSENPETGEIAYKTVEETYINETDELIHVHINGETISATPNHPFYVDKLGWTLAKNLRAGDVLVLSNGEFVVVEWIQHEILENPIKVYNFEVEDFHTYFVGESSVLVHNMCQTSTDTPKPGDADYVGPIPSGSWRLTPNGDGAHLIERANINGRAELEIFNQSNTPRYYPYGTTENAGRAHIRLHEATRNQGIKLRGGNPQMTDSVLLENYSKAYSNPELSGILGDLRTPNGSDIIATNVTPSEAYELLLKWGNFT